MKEFIHLHNHTEYSLLDGCTRIEALVKEAKAQGARAVAITDHGNVYGAIKFYEACQKHGVKPIIGCEFYICEDHNVKSKERYHLILLSKNINGFRNLMKLSSIGYVEGFYDRPRIDFNDLAKYSKDLICLSACVAGGVSRHIVDPLSDDPYGDALAYAKRTQALFAEGDYYIELQNHYIKEELQALPLLRKLAREIGAKTVATNDLHYLRKSDYMAHDVLLCIQTAKDYDDPNRFRFPNDEFYYKTYDEMLAVIGEEESLDNTIEIADKIDLVIPFKEYTIPVYVPPEGYVDDKDYLRKMAYAGLKERYGEITPEIKERADYELNTIITMGFASYYLIVWDFINYAKSHGIPVGAGRGSGVGSIIAYAIKITNVDPLKYDLIFERFLNSSRQTMPDFDVDFCSDRREEVIDYVRRKYGEDHVTQIITFGKMKKKNAIKNVCRVFKIPFAESNALVKNITDNDKAVHIPDLLNPDSPHAVPELIEQYRSNDLYKKIFDIAIQLEDLPRDRGKHAAGVIICSVPVSEKIALSRNGDDITTQFDMVECENLGLLKMDFLALKTLTDIKMAQTFVEKYENKHVDFDELGYEDQEVYKMIGDGETDTVFQLESSGMKVFMKQLKPTLLEEIIAGVSLYRPGPIDNVPNYVYNKQHQDKIVYEYPALEPVLKSTYGIIVYQEQAMRITQVLAGYTLNEADNFRKFISKKKVDQIPMQRKKFTDGCIAKGIDAAFAEKMWNDLETFGQYAFNKSHAAAYAVLTYQTAFYKHYYPVEYLCSVMNNRLGNPDDTTKYLKLIKDMGIKLLPPDINESEGLFLPENGCIRYGLVCIKNVGKAAIDDVVKERNQNGKFENFSDFVRRVPMDALNRRMLESLIKGGAFDCFGLNRSTLMANYENILNMEIDAKHLMNSGQLCFDFMLSQDYKYTEVRESRRVKLMNEKEVLGRYLSGHPLDGYEEEFKEFNFDTTKILPVNLSETSDEGFEGTEEEDEIEETYQVNDGDRVYFGGMLSGVTIKTSKKTGKRWGYATIEDLYGSAEIVFYTRVLEQYKQLLIDDNLVKIKGKISMSPGSPPRIEVLSVTGWTLQEKEELSDNRTLCIRIENDADLYQRVIALINANSGPGCKVIIQVDSYVDGKYTKTGYRLPHTVSNPDSIKTTLIGMVGYNNVKFIQK